jgi:Zn finger protein HypA/HybF involved in hydrogenase expression
MARGDNRCPKCGGFCKEEWSMFKCARCGTEWYWTKTVFKRPKEEG